MRWILNSSKQLRLVVVFTPAIIVGWGHWTVRDTQIDLLAEFAEPNVEIQTGALSLAAAEVESTITTPLEAEPVDVPRWLPHSTL